MAHVPDDLVHLAIDLLDSAKQNTLDNFLFSWGKGMMYQFTKIRKTFFNFQGHYRKRGLTGKLCYEYRIYSRGFQQ